MLLKPLISTRSLSLNLLNTNVTMVRNLLTLSNPHLPLTNKETMSMSLRTWLTNSSHIGTRSYAQLSKPLLIPLSPKSKSSSPSLDTDLGGGSSTNQSLSSKTEPKVENKPYISPIAKFLELPKDVHPVLQKMKSEGKWRTVYKFSHIKTARTVQRFKLYQTAFTCLFAVPMSCGCYLYGIADANLITMTALACGIACTMLYVMGSFFSRLIGYIYVTDEDPDIVRVAHMTFWGTRKDDIFDKADFVPFSELPDNIQDIYIHIKTYSEPENKLYLTLRYGEIHDQLEMENIFGQASYIISRKSKNV